MSGQGNGDRLDQLDYYTLLQVSEAGTADEVRSAFHKFAVKYHPDNFRGAEPADQARAAQIYRRGAEAYRVLTNVNTRAAYDAGLKEGKLRHDAGSSSDNKRATALKKTVNAKARPFWAKAQRALESEQWGQAKLNLKIALQHDPDHPMLVAKLEEINARKKSG